MRSERRGPGNLSRVSGRLWALVLLLAALTLGPVASRADQNPAPANENSAYDPATFLRELNRLKHDVENRRGSTEQLQNLRESLPASWPVESSGRRYDVSSRVLSDQLRRDEEKPGSDGANLNHAEAYLDALSAEIAALPVQPPPDIASARSTLDAILARPEYQHARQKSWQEKLRERINELIARTLGRLLGHVTGQKSLARFLVWIGVAGAVILIAYWLVRRWYLAARVTEMVLQSSSVPARTWQEWIFAARDSAGRGDYRTAIHCSYWAGIARLQELGALAPDRSKTPREYLGALNKSSILQPETFLTRKQALSLLTSRLEKIWYGYHIATETDFRDSLAQLETLGCHLP